MLAYTAASILEKSPTKKSSAVTESFVVLTINCGLYFGQFPQILGNYLISA